MNWQTIETAPKDRRILLFRPQPSGPHMIVMGKWDDDRYARAARLKGYWSHDCERWSGTTNARMNPPSHWCDVTEPNS